MASGCSGSKSASGPSDDFRQAGGLGSNHGCAAGHRLENRQTKALMQRRKNKQGAKIIKRHQVLFRDVAGEHDFARAQAEPAGDALQVDFLFWLHGANNRQLMTAAHGIGQQCKSTQEAIYIFPRVNSARIHDKWADEAVFLQQGRDEIRRIVDGAKMRVRRRGDVDELLILEDAAPRWLPDVNVRK